jgi:hypothetical protein
MATPKSTTHPSTSQVTPTAATAQSTSCNYCQRPISKRILAGRKPYCGKLCAALGLISEVYREDGISNECGEFDALLDSVFYEGPRRIPVRVRWSDALSFSGVDCPSECESVTVVIDDDGTPDWVPDPVLDADQDEIDLAVDRLLI